MKDKATKKFESAKDLEKVLQLADGKADHCPSHMDLVNKMTCLDLFLLFSEMRYVNQNDTSEIIEKYTPLTSATVLNLTHVMSTLACEFKTVCHHS